VHRFAPLALLLPVACTNDGDGRVWELVWQDEFRGDDGDRPRENSWSFDIGTGDNGWGNNELQYYTDRPENVAQNGAGELRITMIEEDFEGAPYTSGRIVTKDKFSFQYGRVEARIKTPVRRAVWPAFWMLGSDIDENPWPLAGEIDIMEVFGERTVGHALHGPGYSGGLNVGFAQSFSDPSLDNYGDEFHIYEMIWDPQQILWSIDGVVTGLATPADLPTGAAWVFDHEFYFLLNMAVGGNPVQAPDDTTPETASMLVDYIKVFERREPLLDPLAPVE